MLPGFLSFMLYNVGMSAIRYGVPYASAGLEIMPAYLLFAFPGLLLALPFVLLFKDAEKYRAWIILMVGTLIGPGFLIAWTLLAHRGHFSWRAEGAAIFMSLEIGVPTTMFYILYLKRSARRHQARVEAKAS